MYQNLITLGLKNQIVYLNKVLKSIEESNYLQLIMTIQVELMREGFILNNEAVNNLLLADGDDIVNFHADVVSFLKEIRGEEEYSILYGDFPTDVLDFSDAQLTYETLFEFFNKFSHTPKTLTYNSINYTVITSVKESVFLETVLHYLVNLTREYSPEEILALQAIKIKYKKSFDVSIAYQNNLLTLVSTFSNAKVSSPIDVLKIAVGFSGGDMSLPPVPKIKNPTLELLKLRDKFKFKLTHGQKVIIMNLFETCDLDICKMKTKSKYQRFIRLGEQLKIGKYQSRFPKTFACFDKLRNKHKESNLHLT